MSDEQQYPECEKLASMETEMRAMHQLLEFFQEDGIGLVKGHYEDEPNIPAMLHESNESIVFRALGIDGKKIEKERQAMLAAIS